MDTDDGMQIIKKLEEANKKLREESIKVKKEIKQMERLSALGFLSAGILHEIKNPLNFINSFAKLSRDLIVEINDAVNELSSIYKEQENELVSEIIELVGILDDNVLKIYENGMYTQRITNGMLGQTRSGTSEFEKTNINQLLEEFVKLSYYAIRGKDNTFNCKLEFNFTPDLTELKVSINQMIRVVINFANNAFYALNEKRKKSNEEYQAVLSVSTIKKEDNQLEIYFKDNGIGIPIDVQEKLFLPFFTTKPIGEGTGLGLSLSYEIITKGHKGTIRVDSVPNEYAMFVISLPTNL